MKKLFLIMTLLLCIGIGLPILAASSGDRSEKNNCRKERYGADPDPAGKQRCKKKEEAKVNENALLQEKREREVVEGKSNPEKEKENINNTSFNFLYYLFYKSSIHEFFKTSECQRPGINP